MTKNHLPALAFAALVGATLVGCAKESQIALRYELASSIDPSLIARVETRVDVAPDDPRRFTADLPYRAVDVGVGYEVRDFDGAGVRSLLITHEAALGYTFGARFAFTLLPPVGDSPPLAIGARALGAGLNEVLAVAPTVNAAFGSGNEVTLALGDQRCGEGSQCSGGDTCCGAKCTDTDKDVANCGSCGTSCGRKGDTCSAGICRCAGGSACASGTTCCGARGCIDTQSDPANCGGCGKACAQGEACVAGVCSCGGKTCGASQACCNGTCTDGGCPCGAQTCTSAAPICCNGACADISDDDANCGACGKTCNGALHCAGGSCGCGGTVCSGGDECCNGGCKQLDSDPKNCGACGKACGPGESCINRECRCGTGLPCANTKICCAADANAPRSCIDPNTRDNCGACGKQCGANDTCVSGQCICPGTTQTCGTLKCCVGVGCFDFSTNPQHCGSCTNVCVGTTCAGGQCTTQPNTCVGGCPQFYECSGGKCVCSASKTPCATGTTCCASGCSDLSSDVNNCGACGNKCGSTEDCCGGTCVEHDVLHCKDCRPCPGLTQCLSCNGTYDCIPFDTTCP